MRFLFSVLVLCVASVADAQTPEPWHARSPDAEATFHVLISPGVAPATIHVDALECPLAVGTPLTTQYDWDFGDPAGKYNSLVGFNAAHVYDQPGKYTIKLTVTTEDGKARSTDATVTIAADTRRQIFVSPGGSDTNAGTSEDVPVRTPDKAFKLLTDSCAIRFKAGGTYSSDATMMVHHNDVLIGRYGDGPNPLLVMGKVNGDKAAGIHEHHGMVSMDAKCDGVTVEHLSIDTPFGVDEKAEAPKVGVDPFVARGKNVTFRDLTFHNVDTAINANGLPTGLLVQDCQAPGVASLRAYLVWGQGTEHVYLGNTVANSTREHCVRLSGVEHVLIAYNNFTNLDRRAAGDKYDTAKGTIEMHEGSYAYITGNTVTGGTIRVGPRGGGVDKEKTSSTDWAVIENNQLRDTEVIAYSGAHHVMARNNVVCNDNGKGFEIAGPDKDGRTSGDFSIVNNTVVNRGSKGMFLKIWGKVDGVSVTNNLFVAPDLKPGSEGTSIVNTESPDLGDFREVSHNVWPTLGGAAEPFVVAKKPASVRAWQAMPQVKQDAFTDVTVDDHAVPTVDPAAVAVGTAQPGVATDRNGKPRPGRTITVGAVEMSATNSADRR